MRMVPLKFFSGKEERVTPLWELRRASTEESTSSEQRNLHFIDKKRVCGYESWCVSLCWWCWGCGSGLFHGRRPFKSLKGRMDMWWEVELRIVMVMMFSLSLLLIFNPMGRNHYSFISWISSFYFLVNFLLSQSYSLQAHWRTLLVFILNGTISLLLLLSNPTATGDKQLFLVLGICLFLLTILTSVTILLFPIPSRSHLHGKFKRVGTCSLRIPILLPPGTQLYKNVSNYDLNVQCWFPISRTESLVFKVKKYFNLIPHATLWSSGHPQHQTTEASQLLFHSAQSAELPSFIFAHLLLSITNSEYFDFDALKLPLQSSNLDSNPNGCGYPIVIYSHGMWSWRQISSSTFEMLASNGFIVFSVDHLPSAMITRPFPGTNDFTPFDYHLPASIPPGSMEERKHYQKGVDRRCHEIIALMDYLSQPKIANKLSLNLDQFHLFGHSFGGGTIAGVACRDQRVTSAVLCKLNFLEFSSLYLQSFPSSGLVDVSSWG
jgi:hypothetical protein